MQAAATTRLGRQIRGFGILFGIIGWIITVYNLLYSIGEVQSIKNGIFGLSDFFDQWNEKMSVSLVLFLLGTLLVVYLFYHVIGNYLYRTKTRVDYAEKYLLKNVGDDWRIMSRESCLEHSKRFGIDYPGFKVGSEITTKTPLYCSLENQMLMLAGPGSGKTSGFVIPFVLDCPGPVVSTSNKDDVYRETYKVRKTKGEVYLFDIMGITGLPQKIWYNPLKFVTDEATAATVSGHFLLAAETVKQQNFWNSEGQTLVADYLLAAAKLNAPITIIYDWVSARVTEEAISVLTKYGYAGAVKTLDSYAKLPPETKGGVFATARYIIAPLANKAYSKWIIDPKDPNIIEFDPKSFVRGSGTLYALSTEKSEGNASGLVATICNHVTDEAENYAKQSHNSHLPHPCLIALDEAANICRWAKLPDLYSYYRAYGITLLTALQSYAQGYLVWGKEGMEKMWSAANLKIFLGGISEIEFLRNVSLLCGQYEYASYSSSHKPDGWLQSSQISDNRLEILSPSELQIWPQAKNKRNTWALFPKPGIRQIYQSRRTLLLTSDGVLILKTEPYYKIVNPIIMKLIGTGEKEYEQEKVTFREYQVKESIAPIQNAVAVFKSDLMNNQDTELDLPLGVEVVEEL
jgi:hypothetical protein